LQVLGIETSCDETGVAIYDSDKGLLAHRLYSQIDIHMPFGGVVPELASRDHIKKTLPLIDALLKETQLKRTDLDAIAYTKCPGLIGALLVGASIGRSLAYALNIPAIGVHHMEGHLLAPMLSDNPPEFPFVALLVSGGHTLLVQAEGLNQYKILGESVDDAVGEAFDKVAKLLGLGYPGGSEIATLAQKGNSKRFHFPRPMVNRPGLDFSFSGIKTFAIRTLQKHGDDEQTKANIACAFQEAIVDTLMIKCRRAVEKTGDSRLIVAGGVSANQLLRERLIVEMKKLNVDVYYPPLIFCTDNGAMIAYAGFLHLKNNEQDGLEIKAQARCALGD